MNPLLEQTFNNVVGTQIATLSLTVAQLQGQLAVANQTIAERDAKIKELENQPPAPPAPPTVEKPDTTRWQ